MAIDTLRNVAKLALKGRDSRASAQSPVVDNPDTVKSKLVAHGTKHGLESLVWVAKYALYRRAWEKAKRHPSTDIRLTEVEDAFKSDFGMVKADRVLERRIIISS